VIINEINVEQEPRHGNDLHQ